MLLRTFALAGGLLVLTCSTRGEDELEKLIDQLTEVSQPGFGYGGYFSGSEFLPYPNSGEMGTLVLGAAYHSPSETLRQIVMKGADAVPLLLKHLSDDRQIKIKPMAGMMWMSYSDEYDFNRRTRHEPPDGVNRDMSPSSENLPKEHALTVGDLCFVALGQIVNRNFSATRYQPTGGLVVSSPTTSKRLREVVLEDWKDFTREKHKRLLIDDFEQADHEGRRIGAYLRLSFYYPETVESLVLANLKQPTIDGMKVWEFCRKQLYKTANPDQRNELYQRFIRTNGPQYSVGVMNQLFQDLDTLEAQEDNRISPPLTEFSTQPRELLIQLFQKPATVRSADQPPMYVTESAGRAQLIGSLTHDKSQKIGDAVREIFLEQADEEYFASACLKCLAARGYNDFLIEQIDKIDLGLKSTNNLHLAYLQAISTSQLPAIQARLQNILKSTGNDQYFMAALAGVTNTNDAVVLQNAVRVLNGLPEDTDRGQELLGMIAERYPGKAKEIFTNFLSKQSARRAETMCCVLWYGHPLSKDLLAPLLDDKRELGGFSMPMRVCDRAAQAISNIDGAPKFDEEWSLSNKDEAILELKKYCAKSK